MTRLREGATVPALDALRSESDAVAAVRALAVTMLRNAYGLEEPPVGEASRLDLRAYGHALRVLDELDGLARLGEEVGREDVLSALERCEVRRFSSGEAGRVATPSRSSRER